MVHKCRVLFMSSLYRDLTDFDVEIFKKEIKVKILLNLRLSNKMLKYFPNILVFITDII